MPMRERAWVCVRHYPRGASSILVSTIRRTRAESVAAYLDGWEPSGPLGKWRTHTRQGVRCVRVTIELEADHG